MIERFIFFAALIVGIVSAFSGAFIVRAPFDSRLLNTASGLLGIASILQLRISGWFESVMQFYGDEAKFPFGPPSHITRQIIDDPDHPINTWIRNTLMFDPNTGAYLGIASLIVAIFASWR